MSGNKEQRQLIEERARESEINLRNEAKGTREPLRKVQQGAVRIKKREMNFGALLSQEQKRVSSALSIGPKSREEKGTGS